MPVVQENREWILLDALLLGCSVAVYRKSGIGSEMVSISGSLKVGVLVQETC